MYNSDTFCPKTQKLLLTLPNFQPNCEPCDNLTFQKLTYLCGLVCSVCFICASVKSSVPSQNSGVAILVLSLPPSLNPYPTRYQTLNSNNQVVSTSVPSPGIHMQEYLGGFLFLATPRGLWDSSSPTRDQPRIKPRPSAVKSQSPKHWTTREFPLEGFLISELYETKNDVLRATKLKLWNEIYLYYSTY